MHYFQMEIKEWVSNTAHLTLQEEGIYLRLINYYYDSEKPIPIDTVDTVLRKLRIKDKDSAVQILDEFFVMHTFENGDMAWVHSRCDAEISKFHSKIEQASRAGKASALAKFNASSTPVEQTLNQSLIINQESLINNHKSNTNKLPIPDGMDSSLWADFLKLRRDKKAPLTQTAWNGIVREAEIAGISVSDAVRICCENTWRTFKAKYLQGQDSRLNQNARLTATQEQNLSAARSIFGDERGEHGNFPKIA